MTEDRAERIAIAAIGWLAGHEDLAPVFLGATGARAEDLRDQAGEAGFLASVLEFLTMDDDWVVAFCDSAGFGYDEPMRARTLLAGPAAMHWT